MCLRCLADRRHRFFRLLALCAAVVAAQAACERGTRGDSFPSLNHGYCSPVHLALCWGDRWLVSANASSNSLTLIDLVAGSAVDEVEIGARPCAVTALGTDRVVACASQSGDLVVLTITQNRLVEAGRLQLGFEPRDVVVSPDRSLAYAALSMANRVAVVDLVELKLLCHVDVGRLPRFLAISGDGTMLAVACADGAEIVLVDTASRQVQKRYPFQGINLGRPAFNPAGDTVYFPWTYYGGSHPSPGNIRRGWVTGSRLGRISPSVVEDSLQGLTLDPRGKAVSDVSDVVLAEQGAGILVVAGGTHELLLLAASGLPFTQISGSETMEPALAADPERFRRIYLRGRPLSVRVGQDDRRAWIANALLDEVQEVDLKQWEVTRSIPLRRDSQPSDQQRLERLGEAIFHDAGRSLDQWYSCHTCHYEGGGNTVTMDTLSDGSSGSYKTVLPLYNVTKTGPWTWHGSQTDLRLALRKSLTETMQGPDPSDDDLDALVAYLGTLRSPESPWRLSNTDEGAVDRGRTLFESDRTDCTHCHAGEYFTSSETYDVGLIRPDDRYPGFSPPSLLGVYRKTRFLHSGRARSLHDVLAGPHSPEKVMGTDPLSERELDDLIAYLRSL